MRYDDICSCVIVHTTTAEQSAIETARDKGFLRERLIAVFTDGRPLIPDADCLLCGGTGERIQLGVYV